MFFFCSTARHKSGSREENDVEKRKQVSKLLLLQPLTIFLSSLFYFLIFLPNAGGLYSLLLLFLSQLLIVDAVGNGCKWNGAAALEAQVEFIFSRG